MLSTATLITVLGAYMAFLFAIAQFVEKLHEGRPRAPSSALVYALAITIYATSWTFYGSIGFAVNSGLLYIAIYIGAIGAIIFWWRTVRGMIHVKESYHISSIADFISARYNRSQRVAALVTLIALLGIVPYIALQLKAVVETAAIITGRHDEGIWSGLGWLVTGLMVVFSILFGARRLDPTERHPGMMTVLAVQALVKLAAFLAAGAFVTWGLYDGLADITQRIHWSGFTHLIESDTPHGSLFLHWATLIILGAASIQCLPRQFHVTVVENSNERHLLTAIWLVPAYLVAISFFVVPIAAAGLLAELDADLADSFILLLPMQAGEEELTLLVFLGGFSAAAGMVIVSTLTLATMTTNHILLPAMERLGLGARARPRLLQVRWLLITLIIASAFLLAREFRGSFLLSAMGIVAFLAVFQFVPAMLLGLVWKRGNRVGALAGLTLGLVGWLYTAVLPLAVQLGWLSESIMHSGPMGIGWLRPEELFGIGGMSPVTHALVWSGLFNLLGYVGGSLLYRPDKLERTQLAEFITTLASGAQATRGNATGLDAYIPFAEKRLEALRLISQYLPPEKASAELQNICLDLRIGHKEYLTIIELIEFHRRIEHLLAGSVGAASAHRAIKGALRYSEREKQDLRAIYSHIVTELRHQGEDQSASSTSPYGLVDHLQRQIRALEEELEAQSQQLERLTERLSKTEDRLFKERLANQQLRKELAALREGDQSSSSSR